MKPLRLRSLEFGVKIVTLLLLATISLRIASNTVGWQAWRLSSKDPEVRRRACERLRWFGPEAREAAPSLIQLLGDQDPEVRLAAQDALAKMGKEAVPALIDALGGEEVAQVLAQIGAPACPALIDALVRDYADEEDSQAARAALVKIGKAAVPTLLQKLKHQSPHVREAVALALGEMSPTPKEAVPVLLLLLRKPNSVRSWKAARALLRLGVTGLTELERAWTEALAGDEDQRLAAATTLAKLGKDAVPALIYTLEDKEKIRQVALDALVKIGKEAVPALSRFLEELGWPAQIRKAKGALDAGIKITFTVKSDLQRAVVVALGQIGPAAKAAVENLKPLEKEDPAEEVRKAATAALGSIER